MDRYTVRLTFMGDDGARFDVDVFTHADRFVDSLSGFSGAAGKRLVECGVVGMEKDQRRESWWERVRDLLWASRAPQMPPRRIVVKAQDREMQRQLEHFIGTAGQPMRRGELVGLDERTGMVVPLRGDRVPEDE